MPYRGRKTIIIGSSVENQVELQSTYSGRKTIREAELSSKTITWLLPARHREKAGHPRRRSRRGQPHARGVLDDGTVEWMQAGGGTWHGGGVGKPGRTPGLPALGRFAAASSTSRGGALIVANQPPNRLVAACFSKRSFTMRRITLSLGRFRTCEQNLTPSSRPLGSARPRTLS
jgi:hypothetical protein